MRVTAAVFYVIAIVIGVSAALTVCGRDGGDVDVPLVTGVTVAFVCIGGATASNVGEGLFFGAIVTGILLCADVTFQPLAAALVGAAAGKFVLGSHNELFGRAGPEGIRSRGAGAGGLGPYDRVRVARLDADDRPFQGTEGVRRAPRPGDVGTIVHEHRPADASGPVVVEMTDGAGRTVWLADFERDELDPAG